MAVMADVGRGCSRSYILADRALHLTHRHVFCHAPEPIIASWHCLEDVSR